MQHLLNDKVYLPCHSIGAAARTAAGAAKGKVIHSHRKSLHWGVHWGVHRGVHRPVHRAVHKHSFRVHRAATPHRLLIF